MASLADTVGNSNQCGFLASRSRHHCSLPGELQVETTVCARDEQEEAEVARAGIHCRDEYRAADRTEDDGHDDVPDVLCLTPGGPGDGTRDRE